MKKIVILCMALMSASLFAGSAEAGSTINTSNIFLMAYYNPGTEISLSDAIQEFDFVNESTGQYVEGTLRIWYDTPDGEILAIFRTMSGGMAQIPIFYLPPMLP